MVEIAIFELLKSVNSSKFISRKILLAQKFFLHTEESKLRILGKRVAILYFFYQVRTNQFSQVAVLFKYASNDDIHYFL